MSDFSRAATESHIFWPTKIDGGAALEALETAPLMMSMGGGEGAAAKSAT